MGAAVRPVRGRGDSESGMVTAELAAALPVLVLVLWVAVVAVGVAQSRVRCADAAHEVALAVARGDSSHVQALADLAAGRAVEVVSETSKDGLTAIRVRMSLRPVGWIGPLTVEESAVVADESGSVGP